MQVMSEINFKTPSGLKIRLNYIYLFCQLTNLDRFYSKDEILSDDKMYNIAMNIETLFLVPRMLIQLFTLFALISRMDIPIFCISFVALFAFGCIWRCSNQDMLISTILMFFATLYNMFDWICYIALAILTFAFDCTYLIIPYISMRFCCFLIEMLQNKLISYINYKKYGEPFNDTEICAFRIFHMYSEKNLKFSDYIELYVSDVCKC